MPVVRFSFPLGLGVRLRVGVRGYRVGVGVGVRLRVKVSRVSSCSYTRVRKRISKVPTKVVRCIVS